MWKPAPSQISTAWTPAGSSRENCSRNRLTTAVFNSGMINAEAAPVAAQTAISTYSHSRPFCRTARGRDPLRAQTRVIVPWVPNRASSWK